MRNSKTLNTNFIKWKLNFKIVLRKAVSLILTAHKTATRDSKTIILIQLAAILESYNVDTCTLHPLSVFYRIVETKFVTTK